jgi:mannose-6-phosphate isomerase-like protein (cupin superfamily)
MHETQRAWILNWFKQGATVKLEELELRHPYFINLCSSLDRVFNGRTYAKPFLTGPSHKGLNVHFDTAEVFVVQLKGTKKWKLWEKVVEAPVASMQYLLSEEKLGPPSQEILLEEGDVLYLPAGTPHSATSQDHYSLHMGLGIEPVKISDVISAYVKMLSETKISLRTSIFPHSHTGSITPIFQEIVKDLALTPFDSMLETYRIAKNSTSYNLSNEMLRSAANSHLIDQHSKVRITLGQSLKTRTGKGVIYVYPGGTLAPGNTLVSNPTAIEFPEYCSEEIFYIIEHGSTTSLLIADIPGKLDFDSKIVLCTSLIEAGALTASI